MKRATMVGDVTERLAVERPAALPRDLKARALSGLVMAAVAIAGNVAGVVPFALLVGTIGIVMSWEWGRLVRHDGIDAALMIHAGAVAGCVAMACAGFLQLASVVVVIAALAMPWLCRGQAGWMSALGVVYVGLPAIALIWLRTTDAYGMLAVLFVFVVVWTTDTFAYVCGRLIGGPKLWPSLSPRKTWAGTLGGVAFAAVAGVVFAHLAPLPAATVPIVVGGVAIALSAAAQVGDLAESALKRAYNVESASQLIPGHGGFMDRMDGIVAAACVAALLAGSRSVLSPGYGLLFWS